jgi:hypothetical protein
MLSLRRFLLAALLLGLVSGCQPKTKQPVGSARTPAEHVANKIKKMQEAPEGPKLRP